MQQEIIRWVSIVFALAIFIGPQYGIYPSRLWTSTPFGAVATSTPVIGGTFVSNNTETMPRGAAPLRTDHSMIRIDGGADYQLENSLKDALVKFRYDSRPLVISLSGLGGASTDTYRIVQLLREGMQGRRVETHVASGAKCATYCLHIFFAGARRTAAPDARFGFDREMLERHEFPHDVDDKWLYKARLARRDYRDLWLTGDQLVEQSSGVLHALR